MLVQKRREATVKFEYGCDLRRLYPWPDVAHPCWGGGIASVRANEATTPHEHDELETFIVLSGRGRMEIEDEAEILVEGDVVLIPKNKRHQFHNLSADAPLVFLSIFWDSPEARSRMETVLRTNQSDL